MSFHTKGKESQKIEEENGAISTRTGLIVGQAPTLADSSSPLSGNPERRLSRLAAMPIAEFWGLFDRTNVISYFPGKKGRAAKHHRSLYTKHQSDGDVFPLDEAKRNAGNIPLESYAVVVMLGLKVARAFSIRRPRLFKRFHLCRRRSKEHDVGDMSKLEWIESESIATAKNVKAVEIENSSSIRTGPSTSPEPSEALPESLTHQTETLAVVFPHPSGVSHFWNSNANRRLAAINMRGIVEVALRALERRNENA